MYLAMIAETLRGYQVQVHKAFLVLQPPVSASASLRSPQCACKASAIQTARLNALFKMERAVIACLKCMLSNCSSLSVQVCTISHHFHTISILLSSFVHLYVLERHCFTFSCEGFVFCGCYHALLLPLVPTAAPLSLRLCHRVHSLLTSCLKVSHLKTCLDCLQRCHQSTSTYLLAALAGCWAPHFVVRQCGSCVR
jgi:hypothetical protein